MHHFIQGHCHGQGGGRGTFSILYTILLKDKFLYFILRGIRTLELSLLASELSELSQTIAIWSQKMDVNVTFLNIIDAMFIILIGVVVCPSDY